MKGLEVFKFLSQNAPYQLYRYTMDGLRQSEYESPSEAELKLLSLGHDTARIRPIAHEYKNTIFKPKKARLAISELKILDQQIDNINEKPTSKRGVFSWEKCEPGSIEGVLNAYGEVAEIAQDKNRQLNVEDIKQIHKSCMSTVKSKDLTRGLIGKTRGKLSTCFGIDRQASTQQGIRDLVATYGSEGRFLQSRDLSKKIKGTSTEILAALLKDRDTPFYFVGSSKNLEKEIAKSLQEYYAKMSTIDNHGGDKDEKLRAIVKVVQQLEHCHPFIDGNCRTFCMVMLNTLLMQNDFPPAIIDDPNKFDGYSVSELVDVVKTGMEQTEDLCLHIQDPEQYPAAEWMKVAKERQSHLSQFASSLTAKLNSPELSEGIFNTNVRC